MSIHLYYYPFKGFVRCKVVSLSTTNINNKFISRVADNLSIGDNEVIVVSFKHGTHKDYEPTKTIKVVESTSYGAGIIPVKSICEKIGDDFPDYPKNKTTRFNMINENMLFDTFFINVNVCVFIRKMKRRVLIKKFKMKVKIVIILNRLKPPKLKFKDVLSVVLSGVMVINKLKTIMNRKKDPLKCLKNYVSSGEMGACDYNGWLSARFVSQFIFKYAPPRITNRRSVVINKNEYIDVKGCFSNGDLYILTDEQLSDYLVYIGLEIGRIPADVWMIVIGYLKCEMRLID